jgi:hypothetical protein
VGKSHDYVGLEGWNEMGSRDMGHDGVWKKMDRLAWDRLG